MAESRVIRLQRRWTIQAVLLSALRSLAGALLVAAFLWRFEHVSLWWSLPLWVAGCLALARSWRVSTRDVARHLDRTVPELEESATLLLEDGESPNLLARLQREKTAKTLAALETLPRPYRRAFRQTGILWAGVLVTVLTVVLPRPMARKVSIPTNPQLPLSITVQLDIRPPAYTTRPVRSQTVWDLKAEQDATLRWTIHSTRSLPSLSLLFSDTTRAVMQPLDSSRTLWTAQKVLEKPGFYQWKTPDSVSGFYTTDLIPDEPPVIRIPSPKSYTVIDLGEPMKVTLRVLLSDDYGIAGSTLHLTTASGSGEAVKFKEEVRDFSTSFADHRSAYAVSETIDLKTLGMHPGDDLYFFVSATDTRHQESRSDRCMVSLPDTTQLMSLEGLASAVNVKPEFFRSERQIIMETEALLKDQPTLDVPAFQTKSADLGVDQKLLRLRYGQFLGEESESGTDKQSLTDLGDFGNADKILDAFTDKHDNAEDASFFDPATKNKLKATLSEMWKAELSLRTYHPAEALPFAYKALRLLKELQQQSRAYVAKTGVKVPPLKPEKRLSGELGAIIEPVERAQVAEPPGDRERAALGALEALRAGGESVAMDGAPEVGAMEVTSPEPAGTSRGDAALEPAEALLIRAAARAPSTYLASLEALGRVRSDLAKKLRPSLADIVVAEKALQRLVAASPFRPGGGERGGTPVLSSGYFHHLKGGSR